MNPLSMTLQHHGIEHTIVRERQVVGSVLERDHKEESCLLLPSGADVLS